MTAEERLKDWCPDLSKEVDDLDYRLILKAMGQYRNEGLRGELIKFKTWVDGNTAIFSMVNIGDDVVDEYLKQKP